MKDLKYYLHLYLGCEVKITQHHTGGDDITFQASFLGFVDVTKTAIHTDKGVVGINLNYVKPILRPLSDMSIPEFKEYEKSKEWHKGYMLAEASGTRFLLSKQFDIFNLIPDGLAIDRTKLNSELSDERSVASKDSQRTNAD